MADAPGDRRAVACPHPSRLVNEGAFAMRWRCDHETASLPEQSQRFSQTPLCISRLWKHRFDIDDRRAINRFHGADFQAVAVDFQHGHAMEANWIWSIR